MNRFRIVIPARYQSVRLPGKVLEKIGDKPILQHVYERAKESGADSIVIATDHQTIFDIAKTFTNEIVMTSSKHLTGTDRIAEVIEQSGYAADDIIISLQADEPFMSPDLIRSLVIHLQNQPLARMATLAVPIKDEAEIFNPNVVKVVLDKFHQALYFSRAPIPWDREGFLNQKHKSHYYYRHHGLYAYYAGFIRDYVKWDHCPIEELECLEQLRALYNGVKIQVMIVEKSLPPGIDTPEDLLLAREYYQSL